MVKKQKKISDIFNTSLSNDILDIIYQYIFYKCHLCKYFTKFFCGYCRKSVCNKHYHFIASLNLRICNLCLASWKIK